MAYDDLVITITSSFSVAVAMCQRKLSLSRKLTDNSTKPLRGWWSLWCFNGWPGLSSPVLFPKPASTGCLRIFCGLAVVLWWCCSAGRRGPSDWRHRLMAVALFAMSRVVHKSIANGMMWMMLVVYAIRS
jgi:hypothetical protein